MTDKTKERTEAAAKEGGRTGSTRRYLEDHPEVLAKLRNRSLLAKDLAEQLGVHFNTVSKALSQMDALVHGGSVAASRRKASTLKTARIALLRRAAEQVGLGLATVDEAAAQAGCSKHTIYRYLRVLEREGSKE